MMNAKSFRVMRSRGMRVCQVLPCGWRIGAGSSERRPKVLASLHCRRARDTAMVLPSRAPIVSVMPRRRRRRRSLVTSAVESTNGETNENESSSPSSSPSSSSRMSTEDVELMLKTKKKVSNKADNATSGGRGTQVGDEEGGDLPLQEKIWKFWAGEKGAIYWANRFATGGLVFMVIGWIMIRFVGPGLGLYEVVDPFADLEMYPPPQANL